MVSQSIQIISRSSSYFLYKMLLLLWVDPKLSWITRVLGMCLKLSRVLHLLRKLKLFITRPLYCFLFAMHSLSRSKALLMVDIVFSDHLSAARDILLQFPNLQPNWTNFVKTASQTIYEYHKTTYINL